MEVSDVHLEKALDEYNATVNMLEESGPEDQLAEAYVNRGCILYMMDYLTSSMEDLSAACEILEEMEENGIRADAGTFVKAHATMGAILFAQNADILDEYTLAISRLSEIVPGSHRFDRAGLMRMCIESAENLLDCEYPDEALEFIDKAMSILSNVPDTWSDNRRLELHNLLGECLVDKDDLQGGMESFSEGIEIGTSLLDNSGLEDMDELVIAIMSRADCEKELGMTDMYLKDAGLAIGLLEEMLRINKLDDAKILVDLHQDIASVLMSKGDMAEAEKHLMKAVSIGVSGAKDYIRNQTGDMQ